jgi:hypothetical protein
MNTTKLSNQTFFRLIGPPSTWIMAQKFQTANQDSIYGRLYKNNMDGLDSFCTLENGLEYVLKNDKVALIFEEPIYSYQQYHCKVKLIFFRIVA